MDKIDRINDALSAMHRSDKGDMIDRIVAKLDISYTAFRKKRNRVSPFRESELKIVLEELKLPLEVE